MGQDVPGLAEESIASAIVSCERRVSHCGAAPERRGAGPWRVGGGMLAPPPTRARGDAPRRGGGAGAAGGAAGRSHRAPTPGACRVGLGVLGWVGEGVREGGSAFADDVEWRTPGGCRGRRGGRDCGLHQRSRLLPPLAAEPRVPAAPAAGNAPARTGPSSRNSGHLVGSLWSDPALAFQGRGGRSGLSWRGAEAGPRAGPAWAVSAAHTTPGAAQEF